MQYTYERYRYYSETVIFKDTVAFILVIFTVLAALLTAYSSMDIGSGAVSPQDILLTGTNPQPTIPGTPLQRASTTTIIAALLTVATAVIQSFLDKRSRYIANSTAGKLYNVISSAKIQWLANHGKETAEQSYKKIYTFVLASTATIENEHSYGEQHADGENYPSTTKHASNAP